MQQIILRIIHNTTLLVENTSNFVGTEYKQLIVQCPEDQVDIQKSNML